MGIKSGKTVSVIDDQGPPITFLETYEGGETVSGGQDRRARGRGDVQALVIFRPTRTGRESFPEKARDTPFQGPLGRRRRLDGIFLRKEGHRRPGGGSMGGATPSQGEEA